MSLLFHFNITHFSQNTQQHFRRIHSQNFSDKIEQKFPFGSTFA